MRNIFFKVLFLLLYIGITGIELNAQNNNSNDQLLQILKMECDRNYSILKSQEPPVYLLSYRLEDQKEYSIQSKFGLIENAEFEHTRIITIQIRVGDQKMDNYREMRNQSGYYYIFENDIKVSINDNYTSLQQTLWRETEKAYRNAVLKYEQIKANTAVTTELEDKSPDYSDSQLESYYEPPLLKINFDFGLWKQKMKLYTQSFTNLDHITSGRAYIRFSVIRKYFVSSEGVSIAQNNTYTHLFLSLETKAEDGMEIPVYKTWFTFYPTELPSDQEVLNEAERLKELLLKLKTAPVVDTYSGPAILSNDASGVFFHEIFGHRVEGSRMKSENDGQTFKKKVGEEVLNKDISIIFDPTIKYYKGIPLNGSYVFDDEGIRGQKVVVVENGILKNFLMSRTPISGFGYSNGHGRAQAGYQPVARQSNLIVETKKPYSDDELREMLITEAKSQGKEYGFYFKTVTGGFTITGRYIPNSFNVTPIEVYRVFVDGRPDELVRGVDLIGTPLAMFSQIGGVGTSYGNFAGTCGAESGGIPAGCCSPAIFVKRIELQKQEKSQEKQPILDRPSESLLQNEPSQEVIFKAMEDELNRNKGNLYLPGLKSPYFFSYTLADATFLSVNASLGGLIFTKEKTIVSQETNVLVGNNKFNNLNFFDEYTRFSRSTNNLMPEEISYTGIRNSFWKSTDQKFKKAAEFIESKTASITQQNISPELLNLPDYHPVDIKTTYIQNDKGPFTHSKIEDIGIQLSKLFEKYPAFTNSGVEVYAITSDIYHISSDGMKYKKPFQLLTIRAFAETQAEDGEPLMDYVVFYFNETEQIPSLDILSKQVVEMAVRLDALRQAPSIQEAYNGPVMFVGDAVAEIFNSAFIKDNNGILASRKHISSTSQISQWMAPYIPKDNNSERLMEKKVIHRNLNIMTYDFLKSYNQKPLIGHFEIDADGVTPDHLLSIIHKGVMKNVLSNRIPTYSSRSSNGHQRFGFSYNGITSTLAPGVVMMYGEKKNQFVLSYDRIKKKLIELAKEEDYEYAYMVVKLPAPLLNLSGLDPYFKSDGSIRPLYVYRINVKDGSETLIRTAKMAQLKMKSFKHVVAVSKELEPFNRMTAGKGNLFYGFGAFQLTGVPTSFILPKAILFKELEIEKDDDIMKHKIPVVPNPID
ncbi:MAG TPA: metallopeptidase TldD-related protein [Bacteroidales bacterium]|nr:metallopeptidase TldD-related protein [Bacteroidales bacterium]